MRSSYEHYRAIIRAVLDTTPPAEHRRALLAAYKRATGYTTCCSCTEHDAWRRIVRQEQGR
jgi:hypothetical protein